VPAPCPAAPTRANHRRTPAAAARDRTSTVQPELSLVAMTPELASSTGSVAVEYGAPFGAARDA
jgi:hypothetical protein